MQFADAVSTIQQYLPSTLIAAALFAVAFGIVVKGLSWLKLPIDFTLGLISRFKLGEKRSTLAQRRHFVDSLTERIKQINRDERWSDRRYSELEAEVETEGDRSQYGPIASLFASSDGVRREKSLTTAIQNSRHRLILLQGDPGSGKSVALRHVALNLADKVRRSSRSSAKIGLYVSLKDFRPSSGAVNSKTVKDYILETYQALDELRQVRYLRDNFDRGIEAGTWVFLFDSFDEIPEVLAAVEVDQTIQKYEQALNEFLQDVAPCRGVVASREYRGPRRLPWPRFNLLKLSEQRRQRLIQSSEIGVRSRKLIRSQLPIASANLRLLADNPMFLGLLCEYVERTRQFPTTSHDVFESYVSQCISDEDIEPMFGLPNSDVRMVAQEIAFCMAAEPGLGLSVEHPAIIESLRRQGFGANARKVRPTIEALRRMRLARSEHSAFRLEGPPFSFAHRRFQEYFATCLVLAKPELVEADQLISNGRWRETAVTVLQMQPPDRIEAIVCEIDRQLSNLLLAISNPALRDEDPENSKIESFQWPSHALHVLGLIDSGLGTRSADEYPHLREKVGSLLSTVFSAGLLIDRKWALDVAAPVPSRALPILLRSSFKSGSSWLREAAFKQVGRLKPVPDDIRRDILLGLLTYSHTGRLRRDSLALSAQLQRLDNNSEFLRAKRALLWVLPIDIFANAVFLIAITIMRSMSAVGQTLAIEFLLDSLLLVAATVGSVLAFELFRSIEQLSWNGPRVPFLRKRTMRSRSLTQTNSLFNAVIVTQLLITGRILVATGNREFNQLELAIPALWLLSWSPSLLIAVRLGLLRTPWFYILPQALALWGVAQALIDYLRTADSNAVLRKASILTLSGILAATIIISFPKDPPLILVIVAGTVGGLILTMWAVLAASKGALLCRDYTRYLRTMRVPPEHLSAEEVVELFDEYQTVTFLRRTFRTLRQRRAFARSEMNTKLALTDLLLIHEALSRGSERHQSRAGSESALDYDLIIFQSETVRAWVAERGLSLELRLRELDADFWDEVAKAVDDQEPLPAAPE